MVIIIFVSYATEDSNIFRLPELVDNLKRFKEIKEGAPNALFIENPKEILEKIKSFCQEGDVVLLESRVPGQLMKQLIIVN